MILVLGWGGMMNFKVDELVLFFFAGWLFMPEVGVQGHSMPLSITKLGGIGMSIQLILECIYAGNEGCQS